MPKILFISLFVWLGHALVAQPTEKLSFDTRVQLQLFGDYYLNKGSRVLFRSISEADLSSSLPSSNSTISQQELAFGYEHFFNSNWASGVQQQVNLEQNRTAFWQTRLHLRHLGHLGRLMLDKQLNMGFNYGNTLARNIPQTVSFQVRTAYPAKLSEKHMLLPALSFQLLKNIRSNGDLGQHRRISRSILRFDLLFVPHPKWTLGAFIFNESQYFFALAQFDENMQEIRPFRKLNLRIPHMGITLRHAWQAENKPKKLFNTID